MNAFITELETTLTSSALWGAVAPAATVVSVILLFAVGVYFLNRVLRKGSRAKAGI